jgi:hypothetical protein
MSDCFEPVDTNRNTFIHPFGSGRSPSVSVLPSQPAAQPVNFPSLQIKKNLPLFVRRNELLNGLNSHFNIADVPELMHP